MRHVFIDEDMEVDVDEDEVISPALPPKVGVRRKLFVEDDDVNPSEGASTNEPRTIINDNVEGRNIRSRFEREPPYPCTRAQINVLEGLKNLSPFASSCASNSPYSQEFDPAKNGDRK